MNEGAHARLLGGPRIDGRRYDIGNRLGWLQANVALALAQSDTGPERRRHLIVLLDDDRSERPVTTVERFTVSAAAISSLPLPVRGFMMDAITTAPHRPLARIFQDHLANSIDCAELLAQLFLNLQQPADHIARIKQLEEKGDTLTAEVYEALASLPDSELVQLNEQFAKHLDDIIDGMNTTARTIDVFMPTSLEDAGHQLAELIGRMVKRLHAETSAYPDNRLDRVRECRAALKRWEENADTIYHEWRKDHRHHGRLSLRAETDWDELLGIMEQTTDACYHAVLLLERLTKHHLVRNNGESRSTVAQ